MGHEPLRCRIVPVKLDVRPLGAQTRFRWPAHWIAVEIGGATLAASRVVKQVNNRLTQVMVVSQRTHRSRRKVEATPFQRGQRNPACDKNAQIEPGVSAATWMVIPPGKENCVNNRFRPGSSSEMFG